MDVKVILAKSKNQGIGQSKESLVEHEKNLIRLVRVILEHKNYSEEFKFIMILLAIFHDLGKMNLAMQERLEINSKITELEDEEEIRRLKEQLKNYNESRHNILSGAFIKGILNKIDLLALAISFGLKEQDIKEIIYKAVILHHGCYDDYIGIKESKVQEDIFNYIEEEILNNKNYDIDSIRAFIENELNENKKFLKEVVKKEELLNAEDLDYEYLNHINEYFLTEDREEYYKKSALYINLKGLLNLIDHGASAEEKVDCFYNKYKEEEIDLKLKEMIKGKIEKNTGEKIAIEKIDFKDFQKKVRANSNYNILTIAFTGSGKTVADYRKGFIKKIFLVPNKISAESFYKDSIFKEDEIGIIHGDVNLYVDSVIKEKEGKDNLVLTERDINLARNFCNPYIIATVDQFLLAIFKYAGYEKVFAAIKGADITIDELHLLTPRMFLIALYFIEFTTKYFDTKFHLMTATMPEFYIEVMNENGFIICNESEEIRDSKGFLLNNIESKDEEKQKVQLKMDIKETEIEKIIIEAVKNNERVLIVKNTINEAIKAYKQVEKILKRNKIEVEFDLLHSRFKLREKRKKFSKILNGESIIWIATQSVEIALDIDFKITISDLATMECLIQRMGRCNRHNKYDFGLFYILKDKEDVYDKKLKVVTLKALREKVKKTEELTLNDRKELLENYYKEKEVKTFFENEFKKSKEDIKDIYGITNAKYTVEDLMFNFDPFINLVDNKKRASKLFRDIKGSSKIILEKDYEEALKIEDKKERKNFIANNLIVISSGIYFKMKGYLELKLGYEVLKENKFFKYSEEIGLEDLISGNDKREELD
ncbi:MAG: CRISPR-associated helicase Cas3' [Sarcina sp.]